MPEQNGENKYKAFFLSQEMIDGFINDFEAQRKSPDEPKDTAVVSQNDIDQLLQAAEKPDDIPSSSSLQESGPESDIVSQSDIDMLLSRTKQAEHNDVTSTPIDAAEDSEVVSQSDIDRLLSELDDDSDADHAVPEISSDETLQDMQDSDEGASAPETGMPESLAADTDASSLISDTDIEQLLTNADQEEESRLSEDETAATPEDEDASLISQTDINQLLALANENEEDIPESKASADASDESLRHAEHDDTFSPAEEDEAPLQADSAARVVLEETEETEDAQQQDEDAAHEVRTGKSWYASRKCLVCCGLLLTLGIASVVVYLFQNTLIPSGRKPSQPVVLTFPLKQSADGMALTDSAPRMNRADSAEMEASTIKGEMKRFFVPAPLTLSGVSYLEADVIMELSSDAVADQIRQHEPFFRGIVYDVMNNALTLQKNKEKIDASDLQDTIQTALNEALPEKGVRKIRFSRFSLF